MFTLGRAFPQLLTGLQFDVSKLSLRAKPMPIPNRATHYIQCRVGYVTRKQSDDSISPHAQQKQGAQEIYDEKILNRVNEIHEEIHKTQLRFTQELHRLTISLSKMAEK
jgi:hypothetical protein